MVFCSNSLIAAGDMAELSLKKLATDRLGVLGQRITEDKVALSFDTDGLDMYLRGVCKWE